MDTFTITVPCLVRLFRNPRASVPMLDLLLQHHPSGLQCVDKHGKTPLHWAMDAPSHTVNNNSATDVSVSETFVRHVIKSHPHAVERVCHKGKLPLHYLCDGPSPNINIAKVVYTIPITSTVTYCNLLGISLFLGPI
jgi:hypothetical protein